MGKMKGNAFITDCFAYGSLDYAGGLSVHALLLQLAEGSLQQQIEPAPDVFVPLSAAEGWKVMQHVTWGLRCLHDAGYVYLDVKPANILRMQSPGRAGEPLDITYKLADFGTAIAVDEHGLVPGTGTGSFGFMAPEELQRQQHNASSDSWSTGELLRNRL